MKKGLLGILAVGMMTTAANAATLSMRFAGGGNEVTLDSSQSATIEIVITYGANDGPKSPSTLTGLDARFDVGDIVPGAPGAPGVPGYRPEYIADGSTKYTVESVSTLPGWNTAATTLGPFNALGFFLSTNSGDAASNVIASAVVASFTVHKTSPVVGGDTFVAFRVGAALPALSSGGAAWTRRWGYGNTGEIAGLRNQYSIGQGNPGDAGAFFTNGYHGYEILQPLVIHNVPEPSSIALMLLGGLAALRRRN